MKKILSLLMVVIMVFSLMACSKNVQETTAPTGELVDILDKNPTEATEKATEVTEEATEATAETLAGYEPTEVTEVTEPATEGTEPTEAEKTPDIDLEDIDVSNALETTSAENPAKVGEWIKSTRYSTKSNAYEVIYWRVVNTTFDCQGDIDEYNNGNNFYEFTPLENDDLAYCMVTYQVYFPEDFPAQEWGITSFDISMSARNPKGGGIEYKGVAYIGLGQCHDITKYSDIEIFPGDVYTGKAIYVMVNDPDVNYVFEYYHNAEGVDGEMVYDYANYK